MFTHIRNCRILWIVLALLSFIAALVGVLIPDIYNIVVAAENIPGVIAQDLVTIVASLVIIVLAISIHRFRIGGQIISLGIMGYLFYAYGIYVIEQLYTVMYLFYMAIFGLSFYSIIYCAVNIDRTLLTTIRVPRSARLVAAVYLIINAVMFNIIWIGQLIPLIQTGTRLEYLFSIYILDLCFIMPLFFIVAAMGIKNKNLGLLAMPSLLALGFLVLIPLVIAEISKPLFYGLTMAMEGIFLFMPLALIFISIAGFYLWKMEFEQTV